MPISGALRSALFSLCLTLRSCRRHVLIQANFGKIDRMSHPSAHPDDPHYVTRNSWLRAAVLGANDGIVSVSSLVVGVAAAEPDARVILVAGVAGLVAGAMSMAAGEYVSVSSQSDTERADIKREEAALRDMPAAELEELVEIYRLRGLTEDTARKVAQELSEHDALGAHVRDELGLSELHSANPLEAAVASGLTFSVAAAIPVLAAVVVPPDWIVPTVWTVTVGALAGLGALGAKFGGAPMWPAMVRVMGWGVLAMAVTTGVGYLFGVNI
jgi:VIT1/CCC1 family predicted Fe2+/Mn2+ transporter